MRQGCGVHDLDGIFVEGANKQDIETLSVCINREQNLVNI